MINRIWSTKPFSVDLGLLVVRVALAVLMLPHGYAKLTHFSERIDKFSDPFGIGSAPSLVLIIFAEFFCSVFLALGLFTRFALIPLIIAMATVAFVVLAGDPFADKEKSLLFLAPYIGLFFTGPGKYSVDRLLRP